MRGDDGVKRFPFLRRRGDVALIALSTALPTAPFLATGRLGTRQLARFAEMLDQTSGLFRIVLIHHPPLSAVPAFLRRLIDGAASARRPRRQRRRAFAARPRSPPRRGLARRAAGKNSRGRRAVGVGASPATAMRMQPATIFSASTAQRAATWRCEMIARQRDADGTCQRTPSASCSLYLGPRRKQQRDGEQRHHADQESRAQRAERAPAPAAPIALGLLGGDARDESGSSSSARCRSTRRRAT